MSANALAKAGVTAAALYAAAFAVRSATVELDHFKASEFGLWWPLMDGELLIKLDDFAERLGVPVSLSPVKGAIGRAGNGNETSQHFPNPLVKAVDVMPKGVSLKRAYAVARDVGFHGIGLYPDWLPRPGLHLDMRSDRTASDPALWSAIKTASGQEYVDISRALA